MANLTTIAQIRALAGFRPVRAIGGVLGLGDYTRVQFSERGGRYFVSPTNDTITTADIAVYDAGMPVVVSSINENFVTLAVGPGGEVTADYWSSNLSGGEIATARTHVEAEVFGSLSGTYTFVQLASSPLIQKIVAYIAAAQMADMAYNDAGGNTVGNQYPPERLRRVGYNLLEQVQSGVIVLTDTGNVVIPIVEEIDAWMNLTTYGDKDRVFENDPFYSNASGILEKASDEEPYRW
jgi:hypothetical protein